MLVWTNILADLYIALHQNSAFSEKKNWIDVEFLDILRFWHCPHRLEVAKSSHILRWLVSWACCLWWQDYIDTIDTIISLLQCVTVTYQTIISFYSECSIAHHIPQSRLHTPCSLNIRECSLFTWGGGKNQGRLVTFVLLGRGGM